MILQSLQFPFEVTTKMSQPFFSLIRMAPAEDHFLLKRRSTKNFANTFHTFIFLKSSTRNQCRRHSWLQKHCTRVDSNSIEGGPKTSQKYHKKLSDNDVLCCPEGTDQKNRPLKHYFLPFILGGGLFGYGLVSFPVSGVILRCYGAMSIHTGRR